MKYSEAFKAKMVQKMLGGRSANSVAQEAGVNQPTLSKWLRDARTLRDVPKRKSEQEPRKSVERRPEDWSAEEKLAAVLQARGLAGTELGDEIWHDVIIRARDQEERDAFFVEDLLKVCGGLTDLGARVMIKAGQNMWRTGDDRNAVCHEGFCHRN